METPVSLTQMQRTVDGSHPSQISLAWLIKVRWGTVLVQLALTLLATSVMHLAISTSAVGPVLAVLIVSNLFLQRLEVQGDCTVLIGLVLVLDVLLLTFLLYLSGGASNPFSLMYLVHVSLAAVALGSLWTWGVTLLVGLCFGLLFEYHEHVPGIHSHGKEDSLDLHLRGMWLAIAFVTGLISYFVSQLTRALRERDMELRRMEALALSHERLASLTTLSAGAAHELSTPLNIISLVAGELERTFAENADPDIRMDLVTIRQEVERCRGILSGMSGRSDTAGEMLTEVAVSDLVSRVLLVIPEESRVRIVVDNRSSLGTMAIFPRAIVQNIAALLKNALEASPIDTAVGLKVSDDDGGIRFTVSNEGPVLDPETLQRIGEPFFTTKPAGEGMGLGVFLARLFAERLGGGLTIASALGLGTQVEMSLPLLSARAK